MIVIISDTHYPDRTKDVGNLLDIIERLSPERIIHAGDVTSRELLLRLESIAPAVAVQGNMDDAYGLVLPKQISLEIEGKKVLVHHGRGIYPRGDKAKLAYLAKQNNARIIITGHTHSPYIGEMGGVLILNPGSPTVPRFSRPTIMVADFEAMEFRLVEV